MDQSLDDDISDEQQDWSILGSLNGQTIPKRGEKDFEPDGTGFQHDNLQSSRQAMYSALAARRSKFSKTYSTAIWIQNRKQAKLLNTKGVHFSSMGKTDHQGQTWLNPEEALYLCERGSLVCYHENGIQLSLQALYAFAITSRQELDNFHVYSYLKKLGFIVLRTGNGVLVGNNSTLAKQKDIWRVFQPASDYMSRFIWRSPFVPSIYRSYGQIFDDLRRHSPGSGDPSEDQPTDQSTTPKLSYFPQFNVWKPGSQFKKSNPTSPDYKIFVISARDHNMPSWNDIQSLLEFSDSNDDFNNSKTLQFQNLSKGYRNSIISVVDSGIVSFYRVCQTDFSKFPVYKMKTKKTKRR